MGGGGSDGKRMGQVTGYRIAQVPVPAGAGMRGRDRRGPVGAELLRFDSSGFRPERDDDEPVRPRPRGDERVLLTMLVVVLLLAALMPISAAALVDLVRYLFG